MVYVPTPRHATKSEQEQIVVAVKSSPRKALHVPVGTPVCNKDVLQFALELCGVPSVHAVLAKAHEIGLTSDDLQILDEQDVAMLLPTSRLHQRKFLKICKFLQDGGVLRHGMSMATIYNGPGDWEGVVNIETTESKQALVSNSMSRVGMSSPAQSQQHRPVKFNHAVDQTTPVISGFANNKTGYSNSNSSSSNHNSHAVVSSATSVATVPTTNYSSTHASSSQATNINTNTNDHHNGDGCGCGGIMTGASNFMTGIQNQLKQVQNLKYQFGQMVSMLEKLKG